MSILIKGAEKPDHCLLCFAFRNGICAVAKKEVVLSKGVQEWCPLVEIPPHGRLIDADKFMKPFCDLLEKDEHSLDYYSVGYTGLDAMISDSPTVIESEEQEHGASNKSNL